jgi:hypothetical protein
VSQHGPQNDRDDRTRDAAAFAQRVEDLVATIRPGAPVPELDRIEGADRSGTVYCVVDRFGAVQDVYVDPGWWTALGPTRVAAAILDALDYARSKAALAMAVLSRHGHRPRLPEDTSQVAGPPIDVPHVDSPDFERAIEAKLDRGYAILDAVRRLRDDAERRERRVVTGPSGLFQVRLLGPVVEGADVVGAELAPHDGDRIASDARLALQEAAQVTRLVVR